MRNAWSNWNMPAIQLRPGQRPQGKMLAELEAIVRAELLKLQRQRNLAFAEALIKQYGDNRFKLR